jgi:hypothetical protein
MQTTDWKMKKCASSGHAFFIYLLITIILKKFHHYVSGCSDDLPSKENVFQPKGFDLLTVFRSLGEVQLEQQEQIVGQHHQLEDRFIGSK